MKTLILTACLLSCLFPCFAKRTILCGEITKTKTTGSLSLYYYASIIDEVDQHRTNAMASVNKLHQYKFVLDLQQPVKVYLQDGDQWLTYTNYISPGDSLALSYSDSTSGFDGQCETCNSFLFEWRQKFYVDPIVREQRNKAHSLPPLGFAAYNAERREAFLQYEKEYFKDKDLPVGFKNYFQAEVDYSYTGELLRYSWQANPAVMRDPAYMEYLHRVPFINEAALDNGRYVNFLRELPYSSWKSLFEAKDTTGKAYYQTNQYRLRDSIAKQYFKGPVYDVALYQILIDELKELEYAKGSKGFDTAFKGTSLRLQAYQHSFSDAHYYSSLMEKMEVLKSVIPAPDFALLNMEGKEVKLSDFKGKVVYVDFWATNCAPCVAELPHIKKLMEHFANKQVVFLFVSIGDSKERLQAFLKAKDFKGIHLIESRGFGSEVAKKYSISSLPRYVLVDRNGFMVGTDAPRPSNHPEQLIQEVLNKM